MRQSSYSNGWLHTHWYMDTSWFNVELVAYNLYVIRERFSLIDNRFKTKFTNIYLLLGETTAALIDTGCGLVPLKPIVDTLIGKRDLLVFNTHNHFDHVGSNSEFDEIQIHRFDLKKLMRPIDISFLKSETPEIMKQLEKIDYKLHCSNSHQPLIGGEKFNLGGLDLHVIHTPGHTPGSICLLSSQGALFTGDTIQYGGIYLPTKHEVGTYLDTLQEISTLIKKQPTITIYPAHENFPFKQKSLIALINCIVEYKGKKKKYDAFLDCWITTFDQFQIIFPKEI